jgi:hypothetical protein
MTDTKIDFGNLEGNIETPDRNSSFERKGLASVKNNVEMCRPRFGAANLLFSLERSDVPRLQQVEQQRNLGLPA